MSNQNFKRRSAGGRVQNHINGISKCIFSQTLIIEYYGSSPGYLLRLMFVYTTSEFYLTLSNIQI